MTRLDHLVQASADPANITIGAWVGFFCGAFWGFIAGGLCGWFFW